MKISIICEKMGWTWDEYWEAPEDFTQATFARWEVEADYEKEELDTAKQ